MRNSLHAAEPGPLFVFLLALALALLFPSSVAPAFATLAAL